VMTEELFDPPRFLRNTTLQNILASSKLRCIRRDRMRARAVEQILDAGEGVRLQGFYSENREQARGLVILLHGWEGSEKSAYIVTTGRILFEAGYSVFRLNLRDHGDSHHLNRGLFFGTLLRESFSGVKAVADRHAHQPAFLVGFSMGGNFAIRIARHCLEEPIPNLRRVFCVNPPLKPMEATRRIDAIPLLRRYFIRKWRRSLARNQALYPDLYDFSEAFAAGSCWEMTEILLRQYSSYPDPATYFGEYTLTENYLDRIEIPMSIITADDDPIIAAADFRHAKRSPAVELSLQPYGGHCGYIVNLRLQAWYWQFMLDRMRPESG